MFPDLRIPLKQFLPTDDLSVFDQNLFPSEAENKKHPLLKQRAKDDDINALALLSMKFGSYHNT